MGQDSPPIGGHYKRLSGLAHWWWMFWEPRTPPPSKVSWRVVYGNNIRSGRVAYGSAVAMAEQFPEAYIERVRP